jgi:membrane protein
LPLGILAFPSKKPLCQRPAWVAPPGDNPIVAKTKPKALFQLLGETVTACLQHNVPRLGAALAYYTLFAIAPLFVIVLAVAAFAFGEQATRRELLGQITGLVGKEGGEAIQAIIAAAHKPKAGVLATGVAIIMLLIGATGVFIELQDALNIIWNVSRKQQYGFRQFIKDRVLSFTLVLGIGFLLLVSLVISATLATVSGFLKDVVPGGTIIWEIINFIISLGVITVLFAMILKMLPNVSITWRDVSVGAFLTACLFNVGKFLLGFYLGRSGVASAYGAAGALVIVLLWVYYSTQILLFGAMFTHLYANRYGSRGKPAATA